MTQEDKELLIKDLCARLPYGIRAQDFDDEAPFTIVSYDGSYFWDDDAWEHKVDKIKPYLFPLSSMTEEQKKEFLSVAGYERREEDCGRHTETYYYDMVGHEHNFYPNIDAIDWLNKNRFDYRGLIPKGLANDATNLNVY